MPDLNIETLLPRPGSVEATANAYPDAAAVANLPSVTDSALITSVIKTILQLGMSLTIIAIVVAGFYYITGRGEEDKMTKAKDILVYLVVGLIIMASAYAIITGIAKFNFFGS